MDRKRAAPINECTWKMLYSLDCWFKFISPSKSVNFKPVKKLKYGIKLSIKQDVSSNT